MPSWGAELSFGPGVKPGMSEPVAGDEYGWLKTNK